MSKWEPVYAAYEAMQDDAEKVTPLAAYRERSRAAQPLAEPTPPPAPPQDERYRLVAELYALYQGVAPGEAELNYYVDILRRGYPVRGLVRFLAFHHGARKQLCAQVIGWFRAHLGQAPTDGELRYFVELLRDGLTPAEVEAQVRARRPATAAEAG